MNSDQFRKAGHEAIERIAALYDNMHQHPVKSDVQPGFLRALLPDCPPDKGEPWENISNDIQNVIMPGLCHWTHPGFMAYFPASSTFEGILGELYCAAYNGPAFDWVCSPSVTELENLMATWLAKLLSLPANFQPTSAEQTKGVIMGSTTECVLSTMHAARSRVLERYSFKADGNTDLSDNGDDIKRRLVVLGGSETHPSTSKAASILGVQYRSIECSPVDGIALTGEKLTVLINQCLDEGLVPFYLTATLGTTTSCAVDDFEGIKAALTCHPQVWVHVDAAFAGSALVCDQYHYLASDMSHFQSLSINLGKWLLTNLDCTVLFVGQTKCLNNPLHYSYSILENDASSSGEVTDYRDWQLSMGRRFRALKVWFVLRSWGKFAIQQHIWRHVQMADQFTNWLRTRPDIFELVCKPQFALNVVRISESWGNAAGLTADEATEKVHNAVNDSGRFWISKTTVNRRVALRVLAANPKSNVESLKGLFELLVTLAEALVSHGSRNNAGDGAPVVSEILREPAFSRSLDRIAISA